MAVMDDPLEAIADEVRGCARCDLRIGARNAVPGSGRPDAEVFLVGEAPSLDDDRKGYPFSGPSGAFLDELLALAGLSRAEVYLTNLVKHRSPESRELLPAEVAACADYLTRQIAVVNPKVIVALGRGALARFLPGANISQIHGQAKLAGGASSSRCTIPPPRCTGEELRATVSDDFAGRCPPRSPRRAA